MVSETQRTLESRDDPIHKSVKCHIVEMFGGINTWRIAEF